MKSAKTLAVIILSLSIIGCAGTRTFNDYARAGDSVAIAAGYKKTFAKDNIQVEIFPSDYDAVTNDNSVIYPPGDANIRVVTNMYVDPLASIVLSKQSKQDLTPFARQHNNNVRFYYTDDDKDWWNTLVIIDTPVLTGTGQTWPVGTGTRVVVTSISDPTETTSQDLEIIPGTGSPSLLSGEVVGNMQPDQLAALGRVSHYIVNFNVDGQTTTLPYAIEIDLIHDADRDQTGNPDDGRAYVVNPIGFIKNASWADDGINTKVILMPTRDNEIKTFQDFKFYVAGGVANLDVDTIKAYDIDGGVVDKVLAEVISVP
jgi:hypothetical protein